MNDDINFSLKIIIIILISLISLLIILSKPSIILNGSRHVKINYNEKYIEPGYKGIFVLKDITDKVKTKNNIDNTKLGKYTVEYSFNISNIKITEIRTVEVVDKIKPVIELIGNNNKCPNKEYIEEGYKAYDEYDGDLTSNVTVIKNADSIIYNVIDSSGNKKSITRILNVQDNEAPIINLNGTDTKISIGSNYNELGATVVDNCDDDLNIEIDGSVNTRVPGVYKVYYKATDKSGNTSQIERNVVVENPLKDGIGKTVYLTFDDGPGKYTKQILNILDKYNVKATFFVTNQFPNYQYLIGEEYKKGHAIAVHSYSHNYDIYYSVEDYINDFSAMNDIIKQYTGNYSKMYRFPGGSSNTVHCKRNPGVVKQIATTMRNNGNQYFDWNLSSGDATGYATVNSVYNTVVKNVGDYPSSVILMHDIKYATANSLDNILANLINRGYTFGVLNENMNGYHHSFGICN